MQSKTVPIFTGYAVRARFWRKFSIPLTCIWVIFCLWVVGPAVFSSTPIHAPDLFIPNPNSAMKHEFNEVKYDTMLISSPAFEHQSNIPSQYTCDGRNINPPLVIEQIPEEAKSLVLVVDDPDAVGGMWVHWVVWNIPITLSIKENSVPGTEGVNDFKRKHYGGPCPPSGTHRYFFKVYALDAVLDLPAYTDKKALEQAMQPHIIAFGEIIGLYEREK